MALASECLAAPVATVPVVEIRYYTDPLCAWCWAFEPVWDRLLCEFGDQLGARLVLGGMIADWRTYGDPLNAVQRPSQMGPQWYQVRQQTGIPIDERIWQEDPPASSFPACLAVKAAEQQGQDVGALYLRRLREAVMLGRRNIARAEVLVDVAEELAGSLSGGIGLDVSQFCRDLESPAVAEAFRADLQEVRLGAIGRFPTLVLHRVGGPAVIVVGYRPYDVLLKALERVAPDLRPVAEG